MNTSANNCDCGGGGIYDVHTETCPKSATPANEWREEFTKSFGWFFGVTRGYTNFDMDLAIQQFIQNLLDQHSAHLVERIESKRGMISGNRESEYYIQGFNYALDQAIGVIKDNK